MIRKIFVSVVILNVVFFAGLLLGSLVHVKGSTPEKTAVKTITGTPLSAVDYSDNRGVHISADYSGAGSSQIDVPLSRIPQAAAWIEKRRSAAVLISPRGAVSILGGYRWGEFQALGSVRLPVASPLSFRDYDFSVGGGLLW